MVNGLPFWKNPQELPSQEGFLAKKGSLDYSHGFVKFGLGNTFPFQIPKPALPPVLP